MKNLFVLICCLMLLGPSAAFAQSAPPTLTVYGIDYDKLRVSFEASTANDNATKKYTLRYQVQPSSSETEIDRTMTVKGPMDIMKSSALTKSGNKVIYQLNLEDLMPSTGYLVEVTAVADSGTNQTAAKHGMTDPADEPDDVRELVLMPEDGRILAEWERVDADRNESPITGYQVQYKMSNDDEWMDDRDGETKNTSTIHTIANLENGTEYTVRVRAYSYTVPGDWSDEEDATPMAGSMTPTPTPALPALAVFMLGAGVLAAGRRRMRQRLLTR